VYASLLDGAEKVAHTFAQGRKAYVHAVRGEVTVNGETLTTGDAAKLSGEATVELANAKNAEILLFDLP
jgi:quercetin 2,3-dioxygenase